MQSTQSPIKNWRELGRKACAGWPHDRQSVVDRWVRRVRQCKKSAKNGCSVTIGLESVVCTRRGRSSGCGVLTRHQTFRFIAARTGTADHSGTVWAEDLLQWGCLSWGFIAVGLFELRIYCSGTVWAEDLLQWGCLSWGLRMEWVGCRKACLTTLLVAQIR